MNLLGKQICLSCLCSDRKMVLIEDFWKKKCFLQIISEIPMDYVETELFLCWECDALISRFTIFKKQTKESYQLLQNYTEQNLHLLQNTSKLRTHKIFNLTLLPDIDDDKAICEIVKSEPDLDLKPDIIKEELDFPDNTSVNSDPYSEDDNKLLIEISSEKKKVLKLSNGIKKKRKKKDSIVEVNTYKVIELKVEELEEERRLLALKEEYVNAMFRCSNCIVSFPNADDLKDHIKAKHELNASEHKCKICERTFASEVSYNYHTNKHIHRFQCLVCMERFISKRGVLNHYQKEHCHGTEMEYKLVREPNNVSLEDKDNAEYNSVKEEPPSFPCEFCDKKFRWKTSLRKHAETHRIETGQKRKPYCEPCRLSFTTTSNLQKHVKTSSKHQIQLKLRKLKESLPEDSTSPEKQQAHIEEIKSSVNSLRQQFPCGQCDKRFQWRGNLLRHLHSHAARANGELVCEPCKRTFSSIATYKQHMKISKKHVSENDFKYMCSNCGKRFANKTRLKDHVDWEHLKNYVHSCAVCQKVFKSHTSLYLHKQVVHRDNAEHLCDHCGKPFPNKTKLRSHIIALHTTESPYKCSLCSARFSWHSCLSRHVRRVHRQPGKRQKVESAA